MRLRDVLPLAVAGAAMLDVLAIVGVVWFAGFRGACGALLLARDHRRPAARVVAALAIVRSVLAVPALLQARAVLRVADSDDSRAAAPPGSATSSIR